jgi:glycosyltransferase involved in cell wall biosynthesis
VKSTVCIVAMSPIGRDARVLRQIDYLLPIYNLVVIGLGDAPDKYNHSRDMSWLPISLSVGNTSLDALCRRFFAALPRKLRQSFAESWYWSVPTRKEAYRRAVTQKPDAWLVNDWDALPIVVEAARVNGGKVILDSHEYAPLEFEDNPRWLRVSAPAITSLLRKYLPHVDASITVVPAIADRLRTEFSLDPIVVLNAPRRENVRFKTTNPNDIRLIHHGVTTPSRRLETLIETIALCDARYSLHLMLVHNDAAYERQIKHLASEIASGRVFFREPVAPASVVQTIAEYDIGLSVIEPSNYNYLVSLPNKFFDYIVAGLPVVVGPSPSMAEIVRNYRCGVVSESFRASDIAARLNLLTPSELETMRVASRSAAEHLNADVEMKKVVELFEALLHGSHS